MSDRRRGRLAGGPGGLRRLLFVPEGAAPGRLRFVARELVRDYQAWATVCLERGDDCPSFDEWLTCPAAPVTPACAEELG